ncbi:hypothetical protein ACEWPL_014850 [Roseovarius sp. S1116L3]|uniref:hypothetical protein n=1 Tax=Roseovarius roseus TaxID=3342636 RepID=UPI003728425A
MRGPYAQGAPASSRLPRWATWELAAATARFTIMSRNPNTGDIMKPIAQSLAALLLVAAPAAAQQTDGTVTGTLDLEERTWNVAGADAPEPSVWREAEDMLEVRINAIPGAGAGADDPAETLTLNFRAQAAGTSPMAEDLSVTLTGAGDSGTLTAAPANTDITLNALSVEGTDMVVTGSFVAVLTEGEDTELVPAGRDGAVTMDGDFQATIQQQESDSGS